MFMVLMDFTKQGEDFHLCVCLQCLPQPAVKTNEEKE